MRCAQSSKIMALLLCLTGCAADFDAATDKGKQAAIDEVNNALSKGQCQRAIQIIDPVYASAYTDNTIRLLRSSAYACAAGFNFFKTLQNLVENNVVGSELWRTLTKIFPAARTDTRMESSFIALESLLTPVIPGASVPIENQVFPGTFNPGSTNILDRTVDSKIYLAFVGMTVVGTVQYRYGKADTQSFDPNTYAKLQNLPWTTSELVQGDPTGCSYAAGIVNMVEGINAAIPYVSVDAADSLNSISSQFTDLINRACRLGCAAIAAADPDPDWASTFSYSTGCTLTKAEATAFCSQCTQKLRSRQGCYDPDIPAARNPTACSAAGLVNFINQDPFFGWQ